MSQCSTSKALPHFPIHILILAGGFGKRMKSSLPKVCHEYKGRPMISWVIDLADKITLRDSSTIKIIVNPATEKQIKETINRADIQYIIQDSPQGTGHAVQCSLESLKGHAGKVLILSGDAPLIQVSTLEKMLSLDTDICIATTVLDDPTGYGRIVRKDREFVQIIEQKDCSESEDKIKEVNGGIYVVKTQYLDLVNRIDNNNAQGEYYLTDLLGIFLSEGLRVGIHQIENPVELSNVNTREQLDNLNRLC